MQAFDQRYVRRTTTGFRMLGDHTLCVACGANSNCVLAFKLKSHEECALYKPVISFDSVEGLARPFNTFRRGLGAFRRLGDGQAVAFYSKADGCIVGEGVVRTRIAGALGQLLPDHAAGNHLMLATPPAEAVERLRGVLTRIYGRNHASEDAQFSVVYVEPKVMVDADRP